MRQLNTPRDENVIDLAGRKRPARRQLVQQLFDQHAKALRFFLMGRSVPPEQMQDIVQELFARLMNLPRLEEKMDAATGSNRAYLLTMANNLIADRQRNRKVREDYAAAQQEIERERKEERTPERILAAQLELEAMRAVIQGMRLNWRVAFVLQRFRNMSYEQIALHMGVTVRQVERYLYRAMQRIEKERRKIEAAGAKWC